MVRHVEVLPTQGGRLVDQGLSGVRLSVAEALLQLQAAAVVGVTLVGEVPLPLTVEGAGRKVRLLVSRHRDARQPEVDPSLGEQDVVGL